MEPSEAVRKLAEWYAPNTARGDMETWNAAIAWARAEYVRMVSQQAAGITAGDMELRFNSDDVAASAVKMTHALISAICQGGK